MDEEGSLIFPKNVYPKLFTILHELTLSIMTKPKTIYNTSNTFGYPSNIIGIQHGALVKTNLPLFVSNDLLDVRLFNPYKYA